MNIYSYLFFLIPILYIFFYVLILMPSTKDKLKTKTKISNNKKPSNKIAYYGALAGLTGLAGLGINQIIKNRSKSTEPMLTMEPVFLEKELLYLKKALLKEQEANKKLVDHINKCNKEVIRLQGLVSKKESLHKEAVLRSTIEKLKNNQKVNVK